MDGTFQIAPKGFTQVFSINGFLKAESGEIVQVPLTFCLMRKRRAVDYVEVFKAIKNLLLIISVEEIVSDFERAVFKAVKKCFPGVHHFGCSFHWKQAILRKARETGFGTEYLKKGSPTRKIIQQLLCLPYLPESKIADVFDYLRSKAPSDLDRLFAYIELTWIKNSSWNKKNWSVFMKATRTNNDCEGLHHSWNLLAKGRKGFYWILHCLACE